LANEEPLTILSNIEPCLWWENRPPSLNALMFELQIFQHVT